MSYLVLHFLYHLLCLLFLLISTRSFPPGLSHLVDSLTSCVVLRQAAPPTPPQTRKKGERSVSSSSPRRTQPYQRRQRTVAGMSSKWPIGEGNWRDRIRSSECRRTLCCGHRKVERLYHVRLPRRRLWRRMALLPPHQKPQTAP